MLAEKTFDDVIENHRVATGADNVRVSLAPGATPDGLENELKRLRAKNRYYDSFSELERERAKVARLHDKLRKVAQHCARPLDASKADLESCLSKVFTEADLIFQVDLEGDVAWMERQREKAGIAFPEAVA